jgi:hypothetical protein
VATTANFCVFSKFSSRALKAWVSFMDLIDTVVGACPMQRWAVVRGPNVYGLPQRRKRCVCERNALRSQ